MFFNFNDDINCVYMLLIRYGKKRKNISKKNVKERIKAKRKRQGKKRQNIERFKDLIDKTKNAMQEFCAVGVEQTLSVL